MIEGGIPVPRTSTKQQEILVFLTEFTASHGYAPSTREICQAVGLKSTASVHYHMAELARQGLIAQDAGKKRAVSIQTARKDQVPILGVVTAGQPILAQENIEGYLPWEGGEGMFALRVRGDSMVNAGILSGDTVVVRPQPDADHGDIVVALLGDEATVKRLSLRDGVWLLPENPAYSPIDGREAVILGRVRAVIREY